MLEYFLCSLELEFGALHKQEGFLETSSALLSLILELCVESVVDHETLMNGQLSRHTNQIADSLVKITELRYFSFLENKLLQVIELCAQAKILMGESLRLRLDLLASL